MTAPLIAIVGDANPQRMFDPPMNDPAKAKFVAEQLGAELARRGVSILVYGGPFIESDVVRGYVSGNPSNDRSILVWYSEDQKPPPFAEEQTHARLFEKRSERGADWEVAFYRSIARADGIILIGGANATHICGQVAIGTRMPILALAEFGGGAKKVWDSLTAGEDVPIRSEINIMSRPWEAESATLCIDALLAQLKRKRVKSNTPSPVFAILAGLLFLAALSVVPWVWGSNALEVWMLFFAPVLAGGAGALIRPMVDRLRNVEGVPPALLATIVLGFVSGGIAGVLFVTAQLTADPQLATTASDVGSYAQRSIPFAVGVGFVAGLTSDAVFGKLRGLEVVRSSGVGNA